MDDLPLSAPGLAGPPAFTEAELRMIAEAEADIAAGRVVPWDEVKAWLQSLGTDAQLPKPQPRP